MKINMPDGELSNTKITTDCGKDIGGVVEADINLSCESGTRVTLTVNRLSDSEFEFLNKDCKIIIDTPEISLYPAQVLKAELERRGYKVES